MYGALGSCLFNNVSFLTYFLTLTPSVNDFAELPATLVSKLGCHVGIRVKQIGFELLLLLYIYIYIYIHSC